MRQRILWLTVGAILLGTGAARAAELPAPLTGTVVSVAVTKDAASGIYTYRYRLANPATYEAPIGAWQFELNRRAGGANLSDQGLVNGQKYLRSRSASTRAQVPMVPVGVTGPDGWMYQLAYREGPPARGLARWGAIDEPFLVPPGQTLGGFQITSYGLPGVRSTEIEPYIDLAALSDIPEEAREERQQRAQHTKTVGPQAPPQVFKPLDFLNYLIALVHESRQQGWIKLDGNQQSLVAKLVAAKRALEDDLDATAKLNVESFVNEVRATACQEFSCSVDLPLTSEAYALLYYNGQYLAAQLPRPGRGGQ